MSNEALQNLNRGVINNVGYKNYPSLAPSINSLDLHIEIYKLIDEYVGLQKDLKSVSTGSSKAFISKRMDDIKYELLRRFWIVEGDKMEPRG